MTKVFIIIAICFSSLKFLTQELSEEIMDFGNNPGNLSLFYYSPKNLKPYSPLVVVLHGCSQGAKAIADLTGWNKLADAYGFCVAYPQQHFPNNPSHCFNWFKKNEIERGNGECESIKEMTNYVVKKFQIDTSKIFITGVSAGAAMSVVMIATHPQLYKAAAIFAGGPYKPGSNIFSSSSSMIWGVDKTPDQWKELVWRENPAFKARYPKLIVYHGTKDPIVNIKNAYELIEQWTCLHQTDTIPDGVEQGYLNSDDITRFSYHSKSGEEVVVFYKVNQMGHAIPINPGNCSNQGGKSGVFASDKKFYSTYYTACDFGLISNAEIKVSTLKDSLINELEFFVNASSEMTISWKIPNTCKFKSDSTGTKIKVKCGLEKGKIEAIGTESNGCKFYFKPYYFESKKP